ncbi:MAG: M50 family metallopeptidase [Candidatus Marsarchaeota archaeon]|nr:M50 family metallopeptidase [Candidatus Marsarchaeota archaeon]
MKARRGNPPRRKKSDKGSQDLTGRPPIIKNNSARAVANMALVIAGFLSIYLAYSLSAIGVLNQWLLALLFLLVVGFVIKIVNSFVGWYGFYLAATKHGLNIIDRISRKAKRFWLALPTWGIMLSFGLLAWPLLKGKISKKEYVFGIISIILMYFLVLPFSQAGLAFITLPNLPSNAGAIGAPSLPTQALGWIIAVIAVISGFSGYIVVLLVYLTALNLEKFAAFTSTVIAGHTQTQILSGIIPGVAPLIPGVDIPLFAGLASIIILLMIHETSHGILSRLYKVKLKSLGLLVFGVLPVGAFVEPDEKEVAKLDSIKQGNIFAAGSAINFFATIVFFLLMLAILFFAMPALYVNGVFVEATIANYPAYNVLQPGMQILSWNGQQIHNLTQFESIGAHDTAGSIINVTTNTGAYHFRALAVENTTHGIIGIEAYTPIKTGIIPGLIEFLYSLFVLSFIFNFSLAVINMLPIPMFDGWRIYKTNIKNNKITWALGVFVVALLVINFALLALIYAVP